MVYFLYNPDGDTQVEFEFDPAKSAANKSKHGIDFEEAQEIWQDRRFFTVRSEFPGEVRYEVFGQACGRVWMAVITMRDGRVRIISVRRARRAEVADYEEGRTYHG